MPALVQFRPGDALQTDLSDRRINSEALGSVAKRDLLRYRTLIATTQRRIKIPVAVIDIVVNWIRDLGDAPFNDLTLFRGDVELGFAAKAALHDPASHDDPEWATEAHMHNEPLLRFIDHVDGWDLLTTTAFMDLVEPVVGGDFFQILDHLYRSGTVEGILPIEFPDGVDPTFAGHATAVAAALAEVHTFDDDYWNRMHSDVADAAASAADSGGVGELLAALLDMSQTLEDATRRQVACGLYAALAARLSATSIAELSRKNDPGALQIDYQPTDPQSSAFINAILGKVVAAVQ